MIELMAIADGRVYRVKVDETGDWAGTWRVAANALRENIERDRRDADEADDLSKTIAQSILVYREMLAEVDADDSDPPPSEPPAESDEEAQRRIGRHNANTIWHNGRFRRMRERRQRLQRISRIFR